MPLMSGALDESSTEVGTKTVDDLRSTGCSSIASHR